MSSDSVVYDGHDILIEEMPNGCVISNKHGEVTVATTQDALALIASLTKMLQVMDEKGII